MFTFVVEYEIAGRWFDALVTTDEEAAEQSASLLAEEGLEARIITFAGDWTGGRSR